MQRLQTKRRSFVVDWRFQCFRLSNYDYRPLFEYLATVEDDSVVIEWDIAVSQEDLSLFRTYCVLSEIVHVAPYLLYPASTKLSHPVWAHRNSWDGILTWINQDSTVCTRFGFGMIYFPQGIVKQALAGIKGPITDDVFSDWHSRYQQPVPIHWDVRPIHLNS